MPPAAWALFPVADNSAAILLLADAEDALPAVLFEDGPVACSSEPEQARDIRRTSKWYRLYYTRQPGTILTVGTAGTWDESDQVGVGAASGNTRARLKARHAYRRLWSTHVRILREHNGEAARACTCVCVRLVSDYFFKLQKSPLARNGRRALGKVKTGEHV